MPVSKLSQITAAPGGAIASTGTLVGVDSSGPTDLRYTAGQITGVVNVLNFGATGNGTTDDSVAIQAAIDSVAAGGGGEVYFPGEGAYKCNLTLKNTVHLRGSSWWQANNTSGPLLIAANPALPIITTQHNGFTVSISGLNFTAGGQGVFFDNLVWSKIENCSFSNFTDQAIKIVGGFANQVRKCFADNCLTNQTRASADGVLWLSGTDHYVIDCEFSGLNLLTAQGFSNAIYVGMSTGWIVNTVAEQADNGFFVDNGTTYVRFMGCRGDTNQGHGFVIGGVDHQFIGCLALQNGRAAANTYSGFVVVGSGRHIFTGCSSEVYAGNLMQYCYDDSSDGTSASQAHTYLTTSTYTGCTGNGWATAFKSTTDPLPASMPLAERIFNSGGQAPTIDVTQSNFCILTGYGGPTTITGFTGGSGGNEIHLLAVDSNITIQNTPGGAIDTGTGANLLLVPFVVYTFRLWDGTWYSTAALNAALAGSNLNFYVATTGNDSHAGTSGSPFLTIQHALNVAATYDYQNLYFPTVNIADGTYANSENRLPELVHCPNGGQIIGNTTTRTNVVVNDAGAASCFTANNNAFWSISGMRVGGTFGGFQVPLFGVGSIIAIDKIDFHGGGTAIGMGPCTQSIISFAFADVTCSSPAMDYFIGATGDGLVTANTGTLTFTADIVFAHNFIWLDGPDAWIAGFGWTIVGAAHVTCTSKCLRMTSAAYFEVDTNTLVDGAPMTRNNFPGHATSTGIEVQAGCVFSGDAVNSLNTIVGQYNPTTSETGKIYFATGNEEHTNGALRADYGKTNGVGNWTFSLDTNKGVWIQGNSPNLFLNDTQTHGALYDLFAGVNGTTPYVGLEDLTSAGFPTQLAVSYDGAGSFQLRAGSMFGWSSNGTFADAAVMDTAISRVAPVSSVPTIAIGNGTAGNASGTIKAKTKAGTPTVSDVPAGTWALIRDTTNATTKIYYNNAGALQSIALA